MQVRVEDISSVKKVLHIEIPQKEVVSEMDAAYKNLRQTAKVKGFRPGKTPRSVLERLYGKNVNAEVSGKLIQESFESAVKESNLNCVGNPDVSPAELNEREPYKYTATVETRPEVGNIDFQSLNLKKTNYRVTEEDIANQLDALQKNTALHKTLEEERPARDGDSVLIDFEVFKDGEPFAEIGKTESYTVKIGSGQILSDLEDGLIGMSPDDRKDINVRFPEDYPEEKFANLGVTFQVSLREIREEILPDINDEFAKKFNCETLDDLKKQISDNLGDGYAKRTEQELNEQAFASLLEKHDFEVPDIWVEPELEAIVSDAERSFLYRNTSMEKLGLTKEMLAEKYRGTAVDQVKRHVILSKLIEQEHLTLPDEELDAGMREMAGSIHKTPEDIRAHYEQNEAELNYFKHTLLEKQAMRLIIENSTIEEVEAE